MTRPAAGCLLLRAWGLLVLAGLMLAAGSPQAAGTTIYANPGDDLRSKISGMSAGDTLILNPGIYTYPNATMMLITNKVGSANAWFTIKPLTPGTVIIKGNSGRNICEIRNSAYWRIENLELDGQNLASDGIKTTVNTDINNDYAHHIVLDGLNIHHLLGNCISAHITTWDLTVQNCWLHDAVLGAYLGGSDGYTPILNLVFQHNLLERHTNYNIQIKAQYTRIGVAATVSTWGSLVKDNVFMRDPSTATAARPNLLVDSAPMSGPGADDLATIEGNLVLANTSDPVTGESGMQLAGNLRVTNNIVMNVKGDGCAGIRVATHQTIEPRRVEIFNNTVFIDGSSNSPCLSVWNLKSGYTQVIANNALIRGSTSAIAYTSGSNSGVPVITNNIVRGTGAVTGMTTITTPLSQIFINPVDTPGAANLYPVAGSPLIDAGSNAYATAYDFNRISRPYPATADVGAYEVHGATNPGWQLAVDFKKIYGDVNNDGAVDAADLLLVANSFGLSVGDPGYDSRCDFDGSGAVDISDVLKLAATWGT